MENGDYLDTKALLGKSTKIFNNDRIYKKINNYKILLDSSQHSYKITITETDVQGAGIAIRIFLEELF